jgi:hypothetical protein
VHGGPPVAVRASRQLVGAESIDFEVFRSRGSVALAMTTTEDKIGSPYQ